MQPAEALLLTVPEAAERLRLSPAAVYEMVRRGVLAALRVGPRRGAIRIRAGDLEECLSVTVPMVTDPRPKPRRQKVKLRHIRI